MCTCIYTCKINNKNISDELTHSVKLYLHVIILFLDNRDGPTKRKCLCKPLFQFYYFNFDIYHLRPPKMYIINNTRELRVSFFSCIVNYKSKIIKITVLILLSTFLCQQFKLIDNFFSIFLIW